ncbi:Uncharacterised protein [Mycobacteroides abscessus subsp. abscessus]|nr:Uncharacterised protein [Mycobacteroides abscessus subsp. abscessus]
MTVATASGEVARLEMISTSGMTGTGLKKCTPTTRLGSATSLAIRMIGIDDVLVARIAVGAVILSSSAKKPTLSASISGSASITSSRSAKSETDVVSERRASACSASSALIFDFETARLIDFSMRARAASAAAWSRSSTSTSSPARIAISAIPAPIVPPPTTPSCVMELLQIVKRGRRSAYCATPCHPDSASATHRTRRTSPRREDVRSCSSW